MFAIHSPKSSTYSTTINLTTKQFLAIDFQSCAYEYFFTKLQILLVKHISELLFLQIYTMGTRIQYKRVNKKNPYQYSDIPNNSTKNY